MSRISVFNFNLQVFAATCFVWLAAISCFAQDRYAIVVGVETYDGSFFENLEFAEEDAIELGKALDSIGYTTTVMTSRATTSQLKPASPEKIMKLLAARIESLGNGDTLIVSFSGHGIQFADEGLLDSGVRETYFCPEDADLTDKSTLIPISKITQMINDSAATRKLLLIDACRNEVVSESGKRKSGAKKLELGSVHENRRSVPGGMSVLFSCSSEQFSWEHKDLGHSVFSNYVIDYLKGNANKELYENGLNLDGMVFHVRKKTNDFVLNNSLTTAGQQPVLRGSSANWTLGQLSDSIAKKKPEVQPDLNANKVEKTDSESTEKTDASKKVEMAGNSETKGKVEKTNVEPTGKVGSKIVAAPPVINGLDLDVEVGERYFNGRGMEQNYEKALERFIQASERNDPYAEIWIGYMYENGFGVKLNQETALEWYTKAASQGLAEAQLRVGCAYRYGNPDLVDNLQALKWFKLAAEQDEPASLDAWYEIGLMYHLGRGVPKDYEQARIWYQRAIDNGHEEARDKLELLKGK